MSIDRDGVIATGALIGLAAAVKVAMPTRRWWLIPALVSAPVAAFFRDPERRAAVDPAAVVAASDGRVLAVETLADDTLASGCVSWLRVSVFLSVLDVHINRAPVSGEVVDIRRVHGGAAAAMLKSAEHNKVAYTTIATPQGPVVVAQRVGILARRIVTRTSPGTRLSKGERLGLIRFGSRTDVYLPAGSAVAQVRPREHVVGGETVIARWH